MAKLILPGEQVAPAPIEPSLERYLKVDVLCEQRVELAARALGVPIGKHEFPDAAPTDLLELRYDDGFVHYISVEQFLEDRREERKVHLSRGEVELTPPEEVPLKPLFDERPRVRSAEERDRGKLRDAFLQVCRVLRLVDLTDSPAGMAGTVTGGLSALAIVSRIEAQLDPEPGVHRLASPSAAELVGGAALRGGEPTLVLIHGTASNLHGSFGGLVVSKAWEALQARYPKRIFGLQHKTLSRSPVQNALDLVRDIPAGAQLHLVSHSRGGLVGELLCLDDLGTEDFSIFKSVAEREGSWSQAREEELDRLVELAARLKEKRLHIERFVRVACPARGTLLASGRLDRYLNIILNLLGLIPGVLGNPVYDFSKSLVLALISQKANAADLPGLEAQMPESPLIALLNQDRAKSSADLGVIAGDMKGSFSELGLLKKLGIIATDLFYRTEHDLVVDTEAMMGGSPRARSGFVFYAQGPEVNHFRYFANKSTADRLVSWLAQKPGEHTDTNFVPIVREGDEGRSVRGTSRDQVDPTAPVVFVLPGIMGSHLKVSGRRVWLDFVRIARAGMAELDITKSGVEPDGVVAMTYEALIERLRGKNTVLPFAYDWRDSIEKQGNALARKIEVELKAGPRPVRILAHSMGGLVARSMIARKKELWRRIVESGGRLVMLGTPNRGSHVIPRLLFGVDRTLRMLALLDTRNNRRRIGEIIAQFPGVLEMLPETTNWEYFDLEWWKQWQNVATLPSPKALVSARAVRDTLKDAVDAAHMIYVAGFGMETPAGLRTRDDRKLEWLGTPRGDGTVSYELGLLRDASGSEVPTYYLSALHGDLANHPPAFDAIEELLEFGATSKLPKLPPPAARDLAPAEPMPDDEPLPYPSERELVASALGASLPRTARTRELPALTVSVLHGDLRLLKHPVVVGHYDGDSIVSAERVLDEQLGGKITMRARLGLYPGAVRTVEMILDREAAPPGAIVVGLGEVGEVTGEKVRLAAMDAALRYAVQASECLSMSEESDATAKSAELGLGVLLMGTHGGNALPVGESVSAIVRGVLQANQALRSGEEPARCWISTLQFVEAYETVATRALHALKRLDPHRPAGFESAQPLNVEKSLRRVGGRFSPPLSEYAGGWWRRIHVTWEPATDCSKPDKVRFVVLTDRARVEDKWALADAGFVDAFLARGIRSTNMDQGSSSMLYRLLVPPDLRERFRTDAQHLVLIVDEYTARYPWEIIVSGAGTDVESFALRYGMLRQFKTSFSTPPSLRSRGLNAVVIGEPAHVEPALPGAREEAELVSRILVEHGYVAPPRVGLDALGALAAMFEDCRILHVAAHGDFDQDKPAQSGIVLGPGTRERFTAFHVDQLAALPELAFINCCHLGAMEQPRLLSGSPSHFAASIARRYIERGVKAIVVAGWAVNDAAAKTFAQTFYREMLQERRFGEAVLAARQATQDKHPHVNTWAAYQCYGDPEYSLEVQKRTGTSLGEAFCSRSEFLYELRGLENDASAKQYVGSNSAELARQIQALGQDLSEEWRDGEMLAAFGDAWAAVGDYKRAIVCYDAAFHHPKGDAPLRAIERFANRLERDTYAQLKATATSAVSERERLIAIRKKALAHHDLLIELSGESSERLNLRAGFYKRSAPFEADPSHVTAALAKAGDAYRAVFERTLKLENRIDPYPGTNWITLAFLGGTETKSTLLAEIKKMLEAAREQARTSDDFWVRVGEPDALAVRHLIKGDLHSKKVQTEVVRAYERARAAGYKPGDFASVIDQLRFVAEMLRVSRPKGHTLSGGGALADALEVIIKRLDASS